ncbi:MAG: filamentous hemagglutinin N-terminal domain-containing protein [Woeseiaceae bacterium]|nr:filamentous hemagglutinin N-terminal domain-containing protein [Woeseiaceae bacterium]
MTTNFLKSVTSINWLRPFSAAKKRLTRHQRTQAASLAAGALLCLVVSGPAVAGPEGGVIRAGDGTITEQGLLTLINQNSDRLAIDWETFNLGSNETVRFIQPGDTSVALNRIFDQNPSQIFGTIEANGRVILINPNGMLFGETAQLNVAGLVASSLSISVEDFMSGNYTLEGTGEGGLILNQGTINADYVALIGEAVANEGLIVADAGVVHLSASRKVAIDFDGGGLMYFESDSEILSSALDVDAAVSNSGTIIADGGRVLLTADAARDVYSQAINNSGLIQARRIDNSGGVIRLSGGAGDTINSGTLDASGDADSDGGSIHVLGHNVGLAGEAVLDASGGRNGGQILVGGAFQGGDASIQNAHRTYVGSGVRLSADAGVVGNGGEVIVWANDITRYHGTITARGGTDGGSGGFAEVSGANTLDFDGHVDLSAVFGANGTLLLDPDTLTILGGDGGGGGDLDTFLPIVDFGDSDGDESVTADALEGIAGDIILEAGSLIVVANQGLDGGNGSIDLLPNTNITLRTRNNSADGDTAGGIRFDVGTDRIVASGTGNITFEGGLGGDLAADLTNIGDLEAGSGLISLSANNDIGLVGAVTSATGDVTISAGGSITVPGTASISGDDVTLRVDDDDNSAETLTVAGTVTGATSVTFAGSNTSPDDTLQSGDGANTWIVNGANDGTLNGQSFSDFANLTGGDGTDSFTFDAALTGTASGGLGDDTFTLNAGGSAGTIAGDGGTDTIEGTDTGNAFVVNAADAGTVNGGAFTGVENLTGGDGADTFTFNAALSGAARGEAGNDLFTLNAGGDVDAINGGDGTDEINGGNTGHTFVLNAADAGLVDGTGFSFVENLTGGTGADTFTLNAALTGTVSGGAGNDTITINAGGGAASFDGGGGTGDELIADGNFNVTAQNAGDVDGTAFTNIENLTGGAGNNVFTFTAALDGTADGGAGDDTFAINNGGSAGAIDGGDGANDEVTYAGSTGPVTVALDTFANVEQLTGSGSNLDTLQGTAGNNTFNVNAADAGTVDGISFTDFENLEGLGGNDRFNLNATLTGDVDGDGGDDTFDLSGGGSAGSYTGDAGNDTLIGGAGADIFNVTAANNGDLNGTTFTGMENLTGGAGADTFNFNAGLSGTASGGAGDDTFAINNGGFVGAIDGGGEDTAAGDEVTYAGSTGPVVADIGLFTDVETLTGSGDAGDVLSGDGNGNSFVVAGANSGTVDGINFSGFENLAGQGGDDTFTLNAGGSVSTIDGGAGSDEIIGNNGANTFSVTVADGGVANGIAFANVENLTGGNTADTFTFNAGLSGTADGGAGDDTFAINNGGSAGAIDGGAGANDAVTYAGSTGPVTVALDTFANVEQLTGSGSNGDTLQGTAGNNTFDVNGADTGTADGIAFAGFENLEGLGGNDTFNLNAALTGTVDGGTGDDTIDLSGGGSAASFAGGGGADTLIAGAGANTFNVTAANAGDLNGTAFTGIENLTGGAGADSFNFNAALSGTASGGAGDDLFAINNGGDAGAIDGGAGSDEVTYAGSTGPVTVAIDRFANIETLRGSGNAGDTLQGTNGADAFSVDGLNSGVANGIDYFDFENLNGLGGNDNFTLNAGGTVTSITGGGGSDSIIGLAAGGNVFIVNTQNVGTANGIAFNEIDNLTGGSGADAFTFNDILDGVADGGAGDDTFTINGSGRAGVYVGGTGNDTIIGSDLGNTFLVNGLDAGEVNGRVFSGVENLTGGAGADVFTLNAALTGAANGGAGDDIFNLNAGGSAGSLDGGAGNDEIDGGDAGNFFVVDAVDSGTANGTGFSNIENLTGGSSADTFTLNASLTGSVDGEAGNDIIDLTGGGSAANYDGGAGTDTLIGNAGPNTFNVTDTNQGDLNGVGFTNIENLTGGAGNDTFNFTGALGGTASGGAGDDTFNVEDNGSANSYNGGAGNDTLTYAMRSAGVTINTSESDAVENIVGSAFDDTINLNGDQSTGLSIDGGGSTGSDSFTVTADSTLGGDLTVTNVDSAAINFDVTANNVTLDVNGAITQAGGVITGQTLTTTSVGGQDILGDVVAFNATNTGSGDIILSNASGVDITGVSQSGGGEVDIDSEGDSAQSGNITTDGGNVSIAVNDGSLAMAAGTSTLSNGGNIDYSTTGTGGDIVVGSLRTCRNAACEGDSPGPADTGVVTITTSNGDILSAQPGTVNVTSDTAVLTAEGDIGAPDNRFTFDGMLIDVERITLNFSGTAFVDSRGILFATNNFAGLDDISDARRETAASAQAAALDEDTSVDWAAYSEDITVYEINNEGVNQPQAEEDDEFANLKGDEAEAPIPVSQVTTP